jgi:hypothetical protein
MRTPWPDPQGLRLQNTCPGTIDVFPFSWIATRTDVLLSGKYSGRLRNFTGTSILSLAPNKWVAVKYVTVRIYGPLTDFLPVNRRQVGWSFALETPASVKDLVEGLGVQ